MGRLLEIWFRVTGTKVRGGFLTWRDVSQGVAALSSLELAPLCAVGEGTRCPTLAGKPEHHAAVRPPQYT